MSEAPRPAVNHDHHLPGCFDAHGPSRDWVHHLLHHLHLCIVVACAQGAQLGGVRAPMMQHLNGTCTISTASQRHVHHLNARLIHFKTQTCMMPRFLARSLTAVGSAPCILPYSSQNSLSSVQLYPCGRMCYTSDQ